MFILLQKVFTIVFPVFALIGIGFIFGKWKKIDLEALNEVNLIITIPALIFVSLIQKSVTFQYFFIISLAAAIVVIGSGILSLFAARLLKTSYKTFLPPMMFMNCGNMGLPLALFAFGNEGLAIAIIFLIAQNTLHFTLGIYMINSKDGISGLLKMPILHATILGFAGGYFNLKLPSFVMTPLIMTGNMSIPLMLLALGYRLTSVKVHNWNIGIWGAFLRPITGIVTAYAAMLILPLTQVEKASLFLFSVLPPAVLNFIFAEKYNVQPEIVASIVVLGTVLSVIYIPVFLMLFL